MDAEQLHTDPAERAAPPLPSPLGAHPVSIAPPMIGPQLFQPAQTGPTFQNFQSHLDANGALPMYSVAMNHHWPGPYGQPFGAPPRRPGSPAFSEEPEDRRPVRRVSGRVRFTPRAHSDADSVTEADNESIISITDPNGWQTFAVPDPDVKVVYEAWEIVALPDTQVWHTWKRCMGINFGVTWRSVPDGFVRLTPLMAFEQGELIDMIDNARQSHAAKDAKADEKAYDQDLANRVSKLDNDIYNRLQRLLDDKTFETNLNPRRQREWTIALLTEEELQMTAMAPERKKRGIFRWSREETAADRWFVVIKGEETKSSKAGWVRHDQFTNPWRKVDRHDLMEIRHERNRQRG
ncbi:hypothetical protein JX265_002529 [Neoarthrinium moseri]|uniref:Uncharacterized protein n=1 Tax=Neoarthrinium moseri TaxID=1658444 RepID=A0A9P9WUL2_9PEZI|nr:uncharacterized protein JN550_000343 [Neoarthrinium moseri]KAI1854890.1 hypothetical protein JX266_001008 [Neoarthrinium moseri]KAI1878161.1 hypothetical protein JN550_000343 [Neoarthrinium moseri]KAI1879575.1 hypothetical protein JX265_002529 [Neoarthrinium moseri]